MNSIEWLTQLVSYDTTSRHSNLTMISFIEEWLKSHNISSHLTYDASGKKANLFATIPAFNETLKGGLILSGHTDVVPADGQQWDTNPFQAVIKDNRVYGRGTCDMKGFIAVVLALIPQFQQWKLKYPLHLAFSFDEEVGCLGAPLLIEALKKQNIFPAACIVGEPTSVRPVVAHKGIHTFRCRLHGKAAHSSLTPIGCNTIEYAADFIRWIKNLRSELQKKQDQYFDVPFSTITSNVIQGGTAINIIPADTEFLFEFRNLPEVSADEIIGQVNSYVDQDLLPAMQKNYNQATIDIESLCGVPAFLANETAQITQLSRAILNENVIYKVSYATEAGLFQNAGIETIVCGPGSIEEAHRANEYVALEQLKKCEDFLLEIVKQFLSS